MGTPVPPLVAHGLLALPGQVRAFALGSAAGILAAADDRGEAGLWDRRGGRLGSWRFRAPVLSADVDPEGARAVFVAQGGDARIVRVGASEPVSFRVGAQDVVVLDRAGAGAFRVAPDGEVGVLDAAGRETRTFHVPGPVTGVASVARTGGLATVTHEGVVARTAPWGALIWGGDWKRYAAGVAADARGDILIVCFLSHGADVLQASSGAKIGLLDLGRPVQCAAVSASHIALGCADGTVALLDRAGKLRAEGRAPGRVTAIGVTDAGAVFARIEDGTVRTFLATEAAAAAPVAAVATGVAFRRELRRSRAGLAPALTALSRDGSRIAVAEAGSRVALLDRSGRLLADEGHDGHPLALRVDDDGVARIVTTREVRLVGEAGAEQVRRYAIEQVCATWSADGSLLAAADEFGTVRLIDGTDASERGTLQLATADVVERLFTSRVGGALETRRGRIAAFGAGWDRDVPSVHDGERARLAGITPDGPVLVLAMGVVGCGWDGGLRWRYRSQSAVESVAALADGRVAAVLHGALVTLARDGRQESYAPRPEGDLAAWTVNDGVATFAWKDGRRLTVAHGSGRVLVAETFESKVLAAALAGDGSGAAALLDGALAVLRVPGTEPASERGCVRVVSDA